jgi:hypothetical protein
MKTGGRVTTGPANRSTLVRKLAISRVQLLPRDDGSANYGVYHVRGRSGVSAATLSELEDTDG